MDTTPLRDAYLLLLDAAATVAEAGGVALVPPPREWNADELLAHIALVDAATIATAASVAAGANATYDNRLSHDSWTVRRTIAQAGGTTGLRERIRLQGEALCILGAVLSDAELETAVPALLLSHGEALVDQLVSLKAILDGLAGDHLPKHTTQLLALLPTRAGASATT